MTSEDKPIYNNKVHIYQVWVEGSYFEFTDENKAREYYITEHNRLYGDYKIRSEFGAAPGFDRLWVVDTKTNLSLWWSYLTFDEALNLIDKLRHYEKPGKFQHIKAIHYNATIK